MIEIIKTASPAIPKTNPERGLFWRKDFPFDPEVSIEGGTVVEVDCVTVVCTVGVDGGDVVGGLLEYQRLGKNDCWFQHTWG